MDETLRGGCMDIFNQGDDDLSSDGDESSDEEVEISQ